MPRSKIQKILRSLWPRRLHARISLLGALLFAGAVTAYSWHIVADQTELGTAALENQARALAGNIATSSAGLLVTRRYSELEELLLRSAQFPDVLRIQVAGPQGRVLSDVARTAAGPQPNFAAAVLRPPAETRALLVHEAGRLTVWQPIEAGTPVGWVRVEYDLRQIATARAKILEDGLLSGLATLAAAVVLFVLFLRRPMRAIARATEFAGRLDERRGARYAVDRGAEEIERLGEALDHVSQRLHEHERAVSATSARLHAVLQNAVDGIITLDEHGRIESCNPAAERVFGRGGDEMVGQRLDALVPDLVLDADAAGGLNFPPYTPGGEIRLECEAAIHRSDGTTKTALIGLSEMWLDERRLFVVVVHDITERKRLDRMKDNFISSVSHELRTPLTSTHAALDLLAHGGVDGISGAARDLAALAYKNSARLIRIVNDILDFESIEAGEAVFEARAIELRPLLEQVIAAHEERARRRGVRITLATDAPSAPVLADPLMLTRALAHLLENAVRLSPPQGEVLVALARRDGRVRITVTDHGPGIPETARKHIFHKFVQVDDADIRYREGAGLGLSLARAVIVRLGGTIEFESAPNVATTFRVELPEAGADAEARSNAGN